MSVYVLAHLKMKNRALYDRYAARFFESMRGFAGRLLVADEAPKIEEGAWDGDKIVLIAFPDEAAYRAWADSPLYRAIAEDRKAGADGFVLLLKGV